MPAPATPSAPFDPLPKPLAQPGPQALDQAGHEGQRGFYESYVVDRRRLVSLQGLKLWEGRIGHTAAVVEGVDDAILNVAHQRNVLSDRGKVIGTGSAGEAGGMLRW